MHILQLSIPLRIHARGMQYLHSPACIYSLRVFLPSKPLRALREPYIPNLEPPDSKPEALLNPGR